MSWCSARLLKRLSHFVGRAVFIALVSTVLFSNDPLPARASAGAQTGQQAKIHSTLAIGSAAPDFLLAGVDGRKHPLSEYKNARALAIVFTCNTCPIAQMYEDRIKGLVRDYSKKGVAVVAIQPDAETAESARELSYTDVDDSLSSMKIRAKFNHFNFPYLYDRNNRVSAKYGPDATPHIFIFDAQWKLRYEGRIDDNVNEGEVKTRDARAALDQVLAGKKVTVPHTPAVGCDVIRKDQVEARDQETKEWEAKPVKLEVVTADTIKQLRANPTGKTLLVNFWASWCGPCVEEYGDLLQIYLSYRSRDLELVTVSADEPDAKDDVLKFLVEHHSGVRNLIFNTDDVYAMQAAFDKHWQSGVPYTMVIAPNGDMIYQREGSLDLLELRRVLLANLPDSGTGAGDAAYWTRALANNRKR